MLISCLPVLARGQTIIWSDNFGTGCNTGNVATSYGWTVTPTGTNQTTANLWYVSAAENGNGSGNCGSGCGTDGTLHLSADPANGGDVGAAYAESDGSTCSFFGICTETNKRVESPTIDCSGYSGITLSFDYIEMGEGSNDNATLWYFDGSTWSQLADMSKTTCCGGPCDGTRQALWTSYSIALPVSADNNPNVKIGFNWTDNMNGVAADPSIAVDDVQLSVAVLPIELTSFSADCKGTYTELNWETATETNNDYFTIEKSRNAKSWEPIGYTEGAGNSSEMLHYSYTDLSPSKNISYYRLKQTDFDGKYKYSDIISIESCSDKPDFEIRYNPSADQIEFSYPDGISTENSVLKIFDISGQKVYETTSLPSQLQINQWSKGIYFIRLRLGTSVFTKKLAIGS